ncbi:MAG: hypothetical protein DRP87_14960, partial [Spirochaetes bacterium]
PGVFYYDFHLLCGADLNFTEIEFFIPGESGTFTSKKAGYIYPVRDQDIKTNKYVFSFTLERGEEKTFYMKFRTNDLMILGLTLYSYEKFIEDDHESQILYGLYYGILGIMIVYNLVLFIFLGDRAYLYYVLFVFFLALNQLQENGLYNEYIRPLTRNWLEIETYYVITGALIFFVVKFATSFLMSRKYVPVLHKVSCLFLLYGALLILLGFFLPSSILDPVTSSAFVAIALGGLALGIICLLKGNRAAKYYLIAFAFSPFGVLISNLSAYNLIPYSNLALNSDQIGNVFMVVLFSIALAYRYRLLRKEKEKAERINLEQTNFFINLSHEIKTPLTLISNYLEKYIHTHGITEELSIVKRNIDKLLRDMVNFFDVLKFKKRMVTYDHSQVIHLSDFLRKHTALFTDIASTNGITLYTRIEENVYLKADPLAMERVINNLLENAIKFNRPEGSIEIVLQSIDGNLRLSISNTGLQIDKHQKENIFIPYYQVSHKKYNIQGIGMGLAIVKNIIDSLKGEIGVRNNDEEGCTFFITLKRCIPGKTDLIAETQPSVPLQEPSPVNPEIEYGQQLEKDRETVLVVEDNRDMLHLLFAKMKTRYNVLTAVNGKEALNVLEHGPLPEVIVSDIMMDDMDGYELLEHVSRNEEYKDIPFIFITARATIDEKLKGLHEGAIDFIYKPFMLDELVSKIDSILRYRNLQKEHYEKEKFASLGMLMGGISHEIFNPLSGITGPLDNIRKIVNKAGLAKDEKIQKHFAFIYQSVEKIEKIIRNIRALYYENKLEKEPVDLEKIVKSVIEEQKVKPGRSVRFQLDIDKEIQVQGNTYALHHILGNLISNALDAVEDGGTIGISLEKENGGKILRVTDNGMGIERKDLGKLFNAFYTTKDDMNRLGLGLHIVKVLVMKMDWDIRVSSTKGKGTSFTILIRE